MDDKFQLCKVQKIPDWDRSGLWSQEDVNQQAMKEVFGIEFPEVEKPKTKSEDQTDDNDLPFGDDDEDGNDEDE